MATKKSKGSANFSVRVAGGAKWLNRFAKLDKKAVRFAKAEGRRLKIKKI